jgi:hypothetical protein
VSGPTPALPPEPEHDDLADAVRDLSETVAALQRDVQRGGTVAPAGAPAGSDAHQWLAVLEAPARRRPSVPRVVLEVLFLGACAAAAAIADLDAVAIVGVMIGAWVLVALIEWAASRADRRQEELLLATPPTRVVEVPVETGPDPAWYSPPAEQTMLDVSDLDATAIGALPARQDDLEATAIGGALPSPDDELDRTVEQRPS